MAALVFAAFGTIAGALAAAGWTSTIALLLALRAAQHRQAVAVQYELHELRQQLHEVRQEQLHAAQAWMQVQEVGELDDAQEDVDEVDPHDEPTRARPARFSWVKRFGWHWPA